MTIIDHHTFVEHPDWCFGKHSGGYHCDARLHPDFPDFAQGDHVCITQSFRAIWGSRIEVGLIAPADSRDRGPRVLLSALNPELSGDGEGMSPVELRRIAETIQLEPEEARMLARFLVEAADERDRVAPRST